ncbi:MAG: VOC family protein [Christensenellales bacterium]
MPTTPKLSGIDLIVIGTSDLEKEQGFLRHPHGAERRCGRHDGRGLRQALYGQEGEAKYAMVMNNVNSTKLMLIEFSEKTGKTTREGFHAWDYGYFDVAWRCNDIDAMYEELTGAGYSFECEPFSYTTSWSGNAVAGVRRLRPDGVPTTMILKTTQEFDTSSTTWWTRCWSWTTWPPLWIGTPT